MKFLKNLLKALTSNSKPQIKNRVIHLAVGDVIENTFHNLWTNPDCKNNCFISGSSLTVKKVLVSKDGYHHLTLQPNNPYNYQPQAPVYTKVHGRHKIKTTAVEIVK